MALGGDSAFGPPNIKCSSCQHTNKTRYKLFRDMSFLQKTSILLGQTFRAITIGLTGIFMGCVIGYKFLVEPTDGFNTSFEYMLSINNWFGIILFVVLSVGTFWFGISEIRGFLNLFKTIRSFEDKYDNNEGFLWSNEWYQ
ncbi:hypothetical protein N9473_03975 [Polaribacter sp.]|nr:hypothetical protein [Polaribacter sp.]